MYVECGNMEYAYKGFNKMNGMNVALWATITIGYGKRMGTTVNPFNFLKKFNLKV